MTFLDLMIEFGGVITGLGAVSAIFALAVVVLFPFQKNSKPCLQCKRTVRWYHRKVKGPEWQGTPYYVFHWRCADVWRAEVDIKMMLNRRTEEEGK